MGLQEGLQIAQWLLNLNRQGQIDRENKAYQDRIIQQQDEQRRQEMATNDAISAMLAGSGEANDMFTQLPSLQNQAKILGTLQATGGMFGGPFSMMGDASRAAYNATSEGVSSFAQNPVLSLARLGLEKGGNPLDVAKYAQVISGMDSPINMYQAEQAARAKDEAERKKFVWQEGVKSTNRREETALSKGFDERIAAMKLRGEGAGGGNNSKSLFQAGTPDALKRTIDLKTDVREANKNIFALSTAENEVGKKEMLREGIVEGEDAFGALFVHEGVLDQKKLTVENFNAGFGKLYDVNGKGKVQTKERILRDSLDAAIKTGAVDNARKYLGVYVADLKNVFLRSGASLQASPETAGERTASIWAQMADKAAASSWNEWAVYIEKKAKEQARINQTQAAIQAKEAEKRKSFAEKQWSVMSHSS